MKKIVALVLTLTTLFSASACGAYKTPPVHQSESVTESETEFFASKPNDTPKPDNSQPTEPNPDQILSNGAYYKMERVDHTTVRYSIFNTQGDEVFSSVTNGPIEISMLGSTIVDINLGVGTEQLPVHRYYDVRNPDFASAKEYSYVIMSTETLVVYLTGELSDRTIVVKSIIDDTFYKEFEAELAERPMPVSSASLSYDHLYLAYSVKGADGTGKLHIPLSETERDYFTDYDAILRLTYELATACPYFGGDLDYCSVLGITDAQQREWVNRLGTSLTSFYSSDSVGDGIREEYRHSVGHAVKDLNGDGVFELVLLRDDYEVIAIFTMVDGNPFLLDHYWNRKHCSIDHNGQLYIVGSNGAGAHSYQMYRIAESGTSLELIWEFGTDGHEFVDDVAVQKYYEMKSGEKVSISKERFEALSEQYIYEGIITTKEIPGLEFTHLLNNLTALQAAAKQAYVRVLENKVMVYDTENDVFCYLSDCKAPYMQTPLSEISNLGYALVDLDDDLVNELVIDCSDMLILRYYEGTVYLYSFIFRNMYYLYTDGSYNWNHNGQDFEYGEKQLYFEGSTLRTRELWRIVNDGEPNAEYYIGSDRVTESEIQEYFKKNPKTKVEFSPFEMTWHRKITPQEALALASAYWGVEDGYREGAAGTLVVHRLVIAEKPTDDIRFYRIEWRWEYSNSWVNPDLVNHIYLSGVLLVDSMTGECKPCVEIEGKGAIVSPDGK